MLSYDVWITCSDISVYERIQIYLSSTVITFHPQAQHLIDDVDCAFDQSPKVAIEIIIIFVIGSTSESLRLLHSNMLRLYSLSPSIMVGQDNDDHHPTFDNSTLPLDDKMTNDGLVNVTIMAYRSCFMIQ
jgi:hypothetical protein